MTLRDFALLYIAIIEFIKNAFKIGGWTLRTVAAVISIVWSLIGNGLWFNFATWQVIALMAAIWIIPAGLYDLFMNTIIPWIGWLLSQIGGGSDKLTLREFMKKQSQIPQS